MYKRYWKVNIKINGFRTIIMVEGTEEQLRDYVASEISPCCEVRSYVGADENDYKHWKALGQCVYMM